MACVAWARVKKHLDNKFICDLRFIKVDGSPCCNDPRHAEVGRVYLCGQYEYCKLSHSPLTLDFGDLVIGQQLSKYIEIRNDSNLPAVISKGAQSIAALHIKPQKLTIPPNSNRKMLITLKPTCLKVESIVKLKITNASDTLSKIDDNFIPYEAVIKVNVLYNKKPIRCCDMVESLKHIHELNPDYAYMGDELNRRDEKRKIALKLLQKAKRPQPVIQQLGTKNQCNSTMSLSGILQTGCDPELQELSIYELLDISLSPSVLEFGKIAYNSHAMKNVCIKNHTHYAIHVTFLKDRRITFTDKHEKSISLTILPNSQRMIGVVCFAKEGCTLNTFKYCINKIYLREQHYNSQAGNPSLKLTETCYKLGMASSDYFLTATQVRLINEFNVSVHYEWEDMPSDAPFSINPKCGSVPKHSTRFCTILYKCKHTRKQSVIVNFWSFGQEYSNDCDKVLLPVEVQVISKKLAMKVWEPPISFSNTPLNIESSLHAKLENCSREFGTFYVVEPLIQGFKVEPMAGIIFPRTLTLIKVIVKLPCIMEFNFEIAFKLNYRDILNLSVVGNVSEPKIVIHPRIINLPRIPSNLLTYVPITIQNLSPLKTLIDFLNMQEENCIKMFELYTAYGNDKHKISEFYIEGNQSKTVFIKICEEYRREFELFLPIQINRILGPPNIETNLTDILYYTRPHS